jgi:hypothetical protein
MCDIKAEVVVMSTKLQLEDVVPTEHQIKQLYELLATRLHSISHEEMPSLTEHEKFVSNHPYRAWYIIIVDGNVAGSIYVQNDNSVGINNVDDLTVDDLQQLLKALRAKISPLEAIPSVRYKDFFYNIPVSNTALQKKLEKIGLKSLQVSYTAQS